MIVATAFAVAAAANDDGVIEPISVERKQSAALEMAKQISLVTPKSGPALDRKVRIQHSN